jgi:putative FmdB family regulatory protein
MPTYEYQCKACGHALEELQSMSEPSLTRCPRCGTENLVRVLGGGAGLIFKGTGFYITDYKKSPTLPPPRAKKKKKGSSSESSDTGSSTPSGSEKKP